MLLCGSYKRNFTFALLFVLEGNSTKIMPRKIHRHPIIAEIESCSFATRTPVNAKTGSIAKIIATSLEKCVLCRCLNEKAIDVANRAVRKSANKKD